LTSRPENVFTLTRESPFTAFPEQIDPLLDADTASLAGLRSTATIRPSNIFKPRWMMLRCPLVGGSKEPGYRAIRVVGI